VNITNQRKIVYSDLETTIIPTKLKMKFSQAFTELFTLLPNISQAKLIYQSANTSFELNITMQKLEQTVENQYPFNIFFQLNESIPENTDFSITINLPPILKNHPNFQLASNYMSIALSPYYLPPANPVGTIIESVINSTGPLVTTAITTVNSFSVVFYILNIGTMILSNLISILKFLNVTYPNNVNQFFGLDFQLTDYVPFPDVSLKHDSNITMPKGKYEEYGVSNLCWNNLNLFLIFEAMFFFFSIILFLLSKFQKDFFSRKTALAKFLRRIYCVFV